MMLISVHEQRRKAELADASFRSRNANDFVFLSGMHSVHSFRDFAVKTLAFCCQYRDSACPKIRTPYTGRTGFIEQHEDLPKPPDPFCNAPFTIQPSPNVFHSFLEGAYKSCRSTPEVVESTWSNDAAGSQPCKVLCAAVRLAKCVLVWNAWRMR